MLGEEGERGVENHAMGSGLSTYMDSDGIN